MKRLLLLLLLLPLLAKAQINSNSVISMGRNALYYEDYVLAIQYFNQVIEAKPYLYDPYYYRAVAKYYLGDYVGAASDCSASIERDPFIDNCFQLRAISLIMTGDYKGASMDYRHLLKQKNHDKDIWYNLVLCQVQLREFKEADRLLDSMIQKWPKYARCYMLKGQIAIEQKDTLTAERLIDQTLAIDSFDVDALASKASLLLKKNDFPLSEQYFDRAIMQSPRKSGFFLGRAIARYEQKKLRGAMDDYNVALDLDPDNYPGHYNRGLLRMQVGENNLAIEDFNFVLLKAPHDRLALYNRALLLEKTGNYRGAIRDYSSVLKDYPNFIAGYENRARCRRKIGDNTKALADERKVFIAQLDETFGNHKRKNRSTRKQKEQNIDEYQNLVVEDESDDIAKFYASDYRGKIQNQEADMEEQPLFVLTFSVKNSDVILRKDYAAFVEKLNERKLFKHELYISSREAAMSEAVIKDLDAENEILVKQTGKKKGTLEQLFSMAVIASAKRDYQSALSALNQVIQMDSNYVAALFLRAVVQERQLEMQNPAAAGGNAVMTDATKLALQPMIADLTHAISLDSKCPYFYYNRGCLYQKSKQSDKAIADYTKAISLLPDMAEAYYNRGLLYIGNSDYQQGLSDLSKAGELGLYTAYSLIKHFRKTQSTVKH